MIPSVTSSILSLDSSGDSGYQLPGSDHRKVPLQHIKSFDDLLKNMDRLEVGFVWRLYVAVVVVNMDVLDVILLDATVLYDRSVVSFSLVFFGSLLLGWSCHEVRIDPIMPLCVI